MNGPKAEPTRIVKQGRLKRAIESKVLRKEKVGLGGSSSEVAADHLAFEYFASEGLFAVTMKSCQGGGDDRNRDRLAISRRRSSTTWTSSEPSHRSASSKMERSVRAAAGHVVDGADVERGVDVADLSLMP